VERGRESWTVIGVDRRPVEPVDRYLAWLTHIEKSPNTVRAYACDLKKFVAFLAARVLAWDRVSLETLGEFTAWLRSPAENVIVLEHGTPARAASSVNRTLSAVFGFYEFHARSGAPLARELDQLTRRWRVSWSRAAALGMPATNRSCTASRRPGRAAGSGGCGSLSGCRGSCERTERRAERLGRSQ
jgi:Phage integrase, N-terminal SAM-like domain